MNCLRIFAADLWCKAGFVSFIRQYNPRRLGGHFNASSLHEALHDKRHTYFRMSFLLVSDSTSTPLLSSPCQL
jgi:hypothetical protein